MPHPNSLFSDGWQNRFLFSLHSSLQQSPSCWGASIAITASGTQEVLPVPVALAHPPFYIAPLAVAPLLTSPLLPFSLAFSCSCKVLQDLGSDHLPILLSVPLSPIFRPNERPPSFNFQKARWDDFACHFDSHCPSAEEYSSLSLSSAAALFTSLALNAAKSSIPFGHIKRPPKAWWSAEVEQAVSTRHKAFLPLTEVMKITRLTSPLLDAPRQSSPKPRRRHDRRLALLFLSQI